VEEIYLAGLLRPRGSSVYQVISSQYLRSTGRQKSRTFVKFWELIADNLSKAGWSWRCVSAVDAEGRTIWIVDAHRDDGKRFVVHADEKLTASLELERITHELAVSTVMRWIFENAGSLGF
jgi:hypothetical protein